MMSRTVRYFKLLYIVAGILTSNEGVCDTVDRIQIAPCVEVKEILQPKNVYRVSKGHVTRASRGWLRRFDVFDLSRLKRRLRPMLSAFSVWTIPNLLLDYSTKYISKNLLGSDCDMIYNR